jgi:ubiquinone/menaquinone biosynthesis C-methylase UbiE
MTSIEQAYDDLLVPRIFEPWAKVLLDRIRLDPGMHLLDVATGSGPVARAASQRIGPAGKVVATDMSAAMLSVAKAKTPILGGAPITYIECFAVPLPVITGTFDVVTCQQSLQFFPNRIAALQEMRRSLKPGGQLAVAVWTEIADNEWFTAISYAMTLTLGGWAAGIIEAPFRWPDANGLHQAIEAAGFSDIKIERVAGTLTFEGGLDQAIAALDAMPIAPLLATLEPDQREAFESALREQAAPLLKDGALIGKMASHIAVATA